MTPFSVVEDDEIKQALDRSGSALVSLVVAPRFFETDKNAFRNSIVVAVALGARAAPGFRGFSRHRSRIGGRLATCTYGLV